MASLTATPVDDGTSQDPEFFQVRQADDDVSTKDEDARDFCLIDIVRKHPNVWMYSQQSSVSLGRNEMHVEWTTIVEEMKEREFKDSGVELIKARWSALRTAWTKKQLRKESNAKTKRSSRNSKFLDRLEFLSESEVMRQKRESSTSVGPPAKRQKPPSAQPFAPDTYVDFDPSTADFSHHPILNPDQIEAQRRQLLDQWASVDECQQEFKNQCDEKEAERQKLQDEHAQLAMNISLRQVRMAQIDIELREYDGDEKKSTKRGNRSKSGPVGASIEQSTTDDPHRKAIDRLNKEKAALKQEIIADQRNVDGNEKKTLNLACQKSRVQSKNGKLGQVQLRREHMIDKFRILHLMENINQMRNDDVGAQSTTMVNDQSMCGDQQSVQFEYVHQSTVIDGNQTTSAGDARFVFHGDERMTTVGSIGEQQYDEFGDHHAPVADQSLEYALIDGHHNDPSGQSVDQSIADLVAESHAVIDDQPLQASIDTLEYEGRRAMITRSIDEYTMELRNLESKLERMNAAPLASCQQSARELELIKANVRMRIELINLNIRGFKQDCRILDLERAISVQDVNRVLAGNSNMLQQAGSKGIEFLDMDHRE